MGQRNYAIDSFRLLGALAVVSLHTNYENLNNAVVLLIRSFGRYAVPFFFITSGYFFYINYSSRGEKQFINTFKNLVSIGLTANIIYFISYLINNWSSIHTLTFSPMIIINGFNGHLWFINSIIIGYLLLCYLINSKDQKLLTIALLVYAVFVLFASYHDVLNINRINDPIRLFISLSFIIIGFLAAKHNISSKISLWQAVTIASFGFLLQSAEIVLLYKYFRTPPHNQEFLFGTLFFSLGITLTSMKIIQNHDNLFSRLGRKYSLMIYLYHPVVIAILFKYINLQLLGSSWVYLAAPLMIFLACLAILMAIEKISPRVFKMLNGI